MAIRAGRRLLRGLGSGVVGTLALSGWEPLRDALLGHSPPYSTREIARRGARRWLGVRLGAREAQRWGLAMRWLYGPMLGAVYAWLRPVLPPASRLRGLTLAGGLWLFERLSFPLLRVTRAPRTWSPEEHRLLALQGLLFGLVTEAVLSQWQTNGQGVGRSRLGLAGSKTETETLTPPRSRGEREVAPSGPLSTS
ncbi:hypothetical protein [Archangium sp.]|uniref:hypothetical protein n=1 Tax=Archangium sp. TaxID=1872627 RepID=UPI003899A98E